MRAACLGVGGQELAHIAAERLELGVRHAEVRAAGRSLRASPGAAMMRHLPPGPSVNAANVAGPGSKLVTSASCRPRVRVIGVGPGHQRNLAVAPGHGDVGLAHVAHEQAVARKINGEDLREAGGRLQPVEEGRRRGGDEVAFAAEANPFGHQPAGGHEGQRGRALVVAEGHELVGQRVEAVIRDHAAQGQFRPRGDVEVRLRQIGGDVVALPVLGHEPRDLRRAAQPRRA